MKTQDGSLMEIETLKLKPAAELRAEMRKYQAALEAQERDEELRRIEAQEKKNAALVQKVDLLLELVPEHSFKTCSDSSPANDYEGRCPRCVLLEAKRQKWLSLDYNVAITVTYVGHLE